MNKDIHNLFESYKAVCNENMPYPEFAKLSKHAASKLPEDEPKEGLKYDYEWATAFLPRDIDISNRAGQDKVLDLAFQEVLKRLVHDRKNPRLAARNMFGDEDFPGEVVSQYAHYQEHGFPNVEDDFREQMPDSKEEYSAHDYAKELEAKGEQEERRLDPSCWSGYHKSGTKMKGDTRVNNCVKNQDENQKVDNIDAYQTKEMEQEEGPSSTGDMRNIRNIANALLVLSHKMWKEMNMDSFYSARELELIKSHAESILRRVKNVAEEKSKVTSASHNGYREILKSFK
jgi:hypothetical protein